MTTRAFRDDNDFNDAFALSREQHLLAQRGRVRYLSTMTPNGRLQSKVRDLPNRPGVYLMRDRRGRVIYVGKARSLRKRVSQYFHLSRPMRWDPKLRALTDSIADVETFVVRSEGEALLLEGRLIKEFKPRYNALLKDDKRFLMVKVHLAEEYPRFKFARLRKDDGARYFGPFAHARAVRLALQWIRKKYGVLAQGTGAPKTKDLKYSTYLVPVPLQDMSRDEYLRRVELACEFLDGRSQPAQDELETQMHDAARQRQFEKAAELRDVLNSLKDIARTARERKFERDWKPKINPQAEMLELQQALGLKTPPSHVEGFDISNISGTLSVASTVCFQGGKPHKSHYRRYRIRTVVGSDDVASMAEAVERRYGRVKREGGALPDLVMVDGGMAQVNAALAALERVGVSLPVLGLAKQLEEIHLTGTVLKLPSHSPALHLIQRLRDEAHRFANAYHQKLRQRRVRESVLDELPGLGERRKRALLQRFGSIQRMRRATTEEIAAVSGLGSKLAEQLRWFLSLR